MYNVKVLQSIRKLHNYLDRSTRETEPELSVGPFHRPRPNPTHQITDPTLTQVTQPPYYEDAVMRQTTNWIWNCLRCRQESFVQNCYGLASYGEATGKLL